MNQLNKNEKKEQEEKIEGAKEMNEGVGSSLKILSRIKKRA